MMALFTVTDLTVEYATQSGPLKALDHVSFSVQAGETLALVGESGSGKSTVALAALGLLGPEAAVSGSVAVQGRDLSTLSEHERRALRGRVVSIVFQDPFTSLNPALPIGLQVAETLMVHQGLPAEKSRERSIEVLAEVGLPNPVSLLGAYPHQLSGGMQQRVLIAGALICNPALLVLDEPTTALDVTVEARILDLLAEIQRRRQLGMLFITHNLGIVNLIADRVCVLYAGRVAETGPKDAVLTVPAHPYTKGLLASLPRFSGNAGKSGLQSISGRLPDMARLPPGCNFEPRCPFAEKTCRDPQRLIEAGGAHEVRCWKAGSLRAAPWPVRDEGPMRATSPSGGRGHMVAENLTKTFTGDPTSGWTWSRKLGLPWPQLRRRQVRAVDGVSLEISPGQVLGLVGESGSGKSTLGRLVLRLIEPSSGHVFFDGQEITGLTQARLDAFRKAAQIVFQNPDSSLNPRRTVGEAIARAVKLHTQVPPAGRRAHVEALIERVALPRAYYNRYPHQLSGGEKQRIGIARALAASPALLVCDEPVSALDVSVQATVLNLLTELRDEFGLSYLFISHDLVVVAHISDRIAVMYAGTIVEIGTTAEVLAPPYHPYTETLLSAIPLPDSSAARTQRRPRLEVASNAAHPTGCPFHGRCPRKLGVICETRAPPRRRLPSGHEIACHIPLEELQKLPSALPVGAASAQAH
jgi:peptide/nickel transport system ATP-binding protein